MPRVKEDKITDIQAYQVREALIQSGYTQFYNKYCPDSVFWCKDVGNKRYFVRVDVEEIFRLQIYEYERWIRDPSKFNLHNPSEQDSNIAQTTKPEHIPDLLDFINSTKTAFPSYLVYLEERTNAGYPLSDYTINGMRGYLDDVLADKENYYLVDVLGARIDKVDSAILNDEDKAKAKADIADAIKNSYMIGVEELYNGLEAYLGKLAPEDEGYLAAYGDKGKQVYLQQLDSLLGLNDFDVEEYINEVDKALRDAVANVRKHSASKVYTIYFGTPEQMMEYLKEFAPTIVPELESSPEITIKEMDAASQKVSNAVAYYMKSALDNTGSEYITLNPVKLKDSDANDDKIIAIPFGDPNWNCYNEIEELPPHLAAEIEHFFQVYKNLEHKETSNIEVLNKEEAKKIEKRIRKKQMKHVFIQQYYLA